MDSIRSKVSRHTPSTPSMPSIFFRSNRLPNEIVRNEIWRSLGLQERSALTASSTALKRLLSPELMTTKFLMRVAQGAQTEAEEILRQHHGLSLHCGDFTDYSGRKFENITAYEYAYWAKDTHMCRMLERNMDEDTKAAMLLKVTAIEQNGLTYQQHGQRVENSKHFDMEPLQRALENYIDQIDEYNRLHRDGPYYYEPDDDDDEAIHAAWMQVGLAQRDLPVHLINEYCRQSRDGLHRFVEFDEHNLPRSLTYYEDGPYFRQSLQPLFPLVISDVSGLGVNFALFASVAILGTPLSRLGIYDTRRDLARVRRIDEVRTADLRESLANLGYVEPEHGFVVS